MKYLLLILLACSSLTLFAQNNLIGIEGGLNLTNALVSSNLPDPSFKSGFSGGPSYEHLFGKHFSIGTALVYDQRGFIEYIIFTNSLAIPTGNKAPIYYKYNYASLPIKTGVHLGNKIYGFANIGITTSILVSAVTREPIIDINGNTTGWQSISATNKVNKYDFSGLAEIGGGYKLKDRYWFFTSLEFERSFTSISNANYFNTSSLINYGFILSLGFKYALTQ